MIGEPISSGSAGGRAEKDQPKLAPCRAAHPSGWIMKHRRCVRDYERLPQHHETYLYRSMIHVMAARITRRQSPAPQALVVRALPLAA